jgi:uncharacterized protein
VIAPRIDVHVHLAGRGTDGSGCWISPAFRRRPTYLLLRLRHGTGTDPEWAAQVAARVRDSELDRAVALGFDGVYDARGALDRARTQMLVPHAWTFEVCRRFPELLPGPSVNPGRRDAMDALEACVEGGAVLLKWLPSVQGIDPSSPAHLPFYRRLAEAGIPLLVHSGGSEQTFAEISPPLADLERLLVPLRAGVRVIVAHSGVPVRLRGDRDQLPLLRELLERFPQLWVDNSGISNPSRFQHLPRLARDAALVERTLHGSDFPVPSNALYYPRALGLGTVARLEAIRNRMQRDIEIKRALGYPDEVLTRGAAVLANLSRWLPGAAGAPPR